ncbi:hypothetical protein BJV78DRAFT_1123192, partial [Lactifluus subvellereus]
DEVDPFKKPEGPLEVSTRGLVPGLKLYAFVSPRALNGSTVIPEYLVCDHVGQLAHMLMDRFCPHAQIPERQIAGREEFSTGLGKILSHLEHGGRENGAGSGLWYHDEGRELNRTEVMVGPWLVRASNVLGHYRAFEPPPGSKVRVWLDDRLLAHLSFKATCSTVELHLDSYGR